MENTLRILILDDEEAIGKGIMAYLNMQGFLVSTVQRPSEAKIFLATQPTDILILDLRLPEMTGLEFLALIKSEHYDVEVIMISGHGDMPQVIEAMRLGAVDFIPKPFSLESIHVAIKRTGKFVDLNNRLKNSETKNRRLIELGNRKRNQLLVYASEPMKQIEHLIDLISDIDEVPVLITGETGTGKELVARSIHLKSKRSSQAFVTANCAATPFDLFESEFFGHTKGSFTGALNDQPGLFEMAENGFLFLDEIGEVDLRLQAKLLRAIENLEVKRIGSSKSIKINTRIVAATNQQLDKLVAERRFREDLFHRLSVFVIHIPPLRERKDDIIPLFEHFLLVYASKFNRPIPAWDRSLVDVLLDYPYPGNVRELRNMVERALVINHDNYITHDCFFFPGSGKKTAPAAKAALNTQASFDLELSEKTLIEQALQKTSGNKLQAARLLKITPQSLRRRMEKFGMMN